MYHEAMKKLFKKIPTMKSKPLSHDNKTPQTIDIYWRSLVYGKMTKGLLTIRKQTLINKAQEKNDKIKSRLHTDNRNWSYWRFQFHWNKLEWVNPRNKIVRKNNIQPLQKIILKNDRTDHWVGHSLLK